jgi:hypothetical protein
LDVPSRKEKLNEAAQEAAPQAEQRIFWGCQAGGTLADQQKKQLVLLGPQTATFSQLQQSAAAAEQSRALTHRCRPSPANEDSCQLASIRFLTRKRKVHFAKRRLLPTAASTERRIRQV